MKIYEYITAHGHLDEKHLIQLQQHRGFSHETIEMNRFFSGGSYLKHLEEDLKKNFTIEELIKSKVFNEKDTLNQQLLSNRVIIPYLDEKRICYHLRPHKLGFKDSNVQIYQSFNLKDKPREIILTEGEFKAATGAQYGFPTIAVPGISSFAGKHFQTLVDFLKRFEVQRIAILFDKEIKDNPEFSNFKEDPLKRFDTEYYSYLLAYLLASKGKFEVKIATFPTEWMRMGKIDFDGALAQGKSRDEIFEVLQHAKTYTKFKDDLDPEAREIVEKKLQKRFFKPKLKKQFNRYVVTRKNDKVEYDENLSNFIIKIVNTLDTPEGIIRNVQFVNDINQKSKVFPLNACDMKATEKFREFCYNKGNFVWKGSNSDLLDLWEEEFVHDDSKLIFLPDHIGWIQNHDCWLFGNRMFGPNEIQADESGVFWKKDKGLKPNPITEGTLPFLYEDDFDIQEFIQRMGETIGISRTYICLSWIASVLFIEDIFKSYGCFPYLFILGKTRSGKSTIAEWLMNFFGMENSGKMASDSTPVALQRLMAYHSSLPVFVDEYRNTRKIQAKDSLLRSAYNRQFASKGIKSSFGLREGKIRGTLLIAGEELPLDSALASRCIEIYISRKDRTQNHISWFNANKRKFSRFTLDILRQKNEITPKFMAALAENNKALEREYDDPRINVHYAIIGTASEILLKYQSLELNDFLKFEVSRAKEEADGIHILSEFLDSVEYVYTTEGNGSKPQVVDYDPVRDEIFFWYAGAFNEFLKHRKSIGQDSFDRLSVLKYLKEEKGFVRHNEARHFPKEQIRRKCCVFEFKNAPEELKNLVIKLQEGNTKSNQSNYLE